MKSSFLSSIDAEIAVKFEERLKKLNIEDERSDLIEKLIKRWLNETEEVKIENAPTGSI